MAETKQAARAQRPLSPHLQIYRPMLSMTMSITHRITGVALYAGSLLLVWWFAAAAQSDAYFDLVQAFFAHWFGRLILFGFTWALIHHALGGLRHFVWDMGKGFKLTSVEWMVRANLVGSIVLTLLLWAVAYGVKS
ncbi:succinate dehydrogenase, cytochrome b556 subunit [Aestuariivirga sp.]|uniref:succinate dehydrogenase, cytochrome b556 subunit n=1 Tax=Aestuariivirga sp. TaxID=2650926 RepID=UPI0039E71931